MEIDNEDGLVIVEQHSLSERHDEPMTEEQKAAHNAFLAKRDKHYSEFKVLQALRAKQADFDEDDEED